MKSLRFLDRRAGYSLASLGLLLGMVVPSIFPAFTSADQLLTRSIEMSSAIPGNQAGGTGVTYQVTFDPSAVFKSFVIDFCTESPIPGQTCTAPTGLNIGTTVAFTTGSIGTLTTTGSTASHLEVDGSASTADDNSVTFTISNVTNPTTLGTFYARIYTYTGANDWTNNTSGIGTTLDQGSVALSVTNPITVSAAVRETLTFCVSGSDPEQNCGNTTSAALTLGTGTPQALDPSVLSTGTVYTQLTTNAVSGATVRMKSNATGCGGLFRNNTSNSTNCGIEPQNTPGNTITAGNAFFGVKLGTMTNPAGTLTVTPSGTLQAANGSDYDDTNYYMNYVSGDGSGVTSTYGDPVLDSASGPINNKNIPLEFAASASATTPAGIYKATISLIATGTF